MSTTVLPGFPSFEKIGGQWIFGGASDFSNLLAPWASGSRSLMLRAAKASAELTPSSTIGLTFVNEVVSSADYFSTALIIINKA